MASKEQTHRSDDASSTHELSERATRNSDLPARQQNQPATLIQRAMQRPELLTPSDVLQLQRTVGNQATGKVLANIPRPATLLHPQRLATMPPSLMEDEGKTEAGAMEGATEAQAVTWCEAESGTVEPGPLNEWGEMDGELSSDTSPHVFVNGGKTGTGVVNWAGGNGGAGNQGVGTITLVAPQYDSEDAADAGADHATAWAWVRPGTGTATVTRSYRGVLIGANTNAYYFTASAAARADVHEELHVASSQSLHNTHISPLEARIRQYTGRDRALRQGTTPAQAIAALQALIDWNTSITAFSTADTAANTPMGTVDAADLASPTFVRNLGPRTVAGVNYANYIDTPP